MIVLTFLNQKNEQYRLVIFNDDYVDAILDQMNIGKWQQIDNQKFNSENAISIQVVDETTNEQVGYLSFDKNLIQ